MKANFSNRNQLNTKEGNDLKILIPMIDSVFMQLRKKASPDVENEWKDLFSKKIILNLDTFLKEISEEIGITYYSDIRIDELRNYIENLTK